MSETGSKTDLDFMAFVFGDFGVTLNKANYYKRLKFLFWVLRFQYGVITLNYQFKFLVVIYSLNITNPAKYTRMNYI